MSTLFADFEGANDNIITPIQTEIANMEDAALRITQLMEELSQYWGGASYDSAQATYQSDYQDFIETKVPELMEEFKGYLQGCLDKLRETDADLALK